MKYLSFVSVAVLAFALQTTVSHAAPVSVQTPGQTAGTAVSVPAELTKRIDAKKAKIGNEVTARITEDTKLPDGTPLPKGTKLVGTVTSVPGKDGNGRLTLDFDRAVLHSGQAVLVHTSMTSMAGTPAVADAATSTDNTVASADQNNYDSGTKMTLDVSSRGR